MTTSTGSAFYPPERCGNGDPNGRRGELCNFRSCQCVQLFEMSMAQTGVVTVASQLRAILRSQPRYIVSVGVCSAIQSGSSPPLPELVVMVRMNLYEVISQ